MRLSLCHFGPRVLGTDRVLACLVYNCPVPDSAVEDRHEQIRNCSVGGIERYVRADPPVVANLELVCQWLKSGAAAAEKRFTDLFLRKLGVRSALNVPLHLNTEACGVLGLYRKEHRPFTPDDLAKIEDIAKSANRLRDALDSTGAGE